MKLVISQPIQNIPDYLKEFYEEGYKAFDDGIRIWNCPYKGLIPLEKAWQQGWNDREVEVVSEHDMEHDMEHDSEFTNDLRDWDYWIKERK